MGMNSDDVQKFINKLRTDRDELRLRMHLASMEVRDEWEELEGRWDKLEARLQNAGETLAESGREVGEGLEIVVDELGSAYGRIRKRLADD